MSRLWRIGLPIGIAILAATVLYAGAGAVAHALERLSVAGLLLLVLLHLPAVVLMALAWWLVSGPVQIASLRRFVWARLLRDAAAEALPFSQLGGFVLGARALSASASRLVRAALSMCVDLVVELTAKLPYLLAGLLALSALASGSALMRPISYVLGLTAALVAILLLGRQAVGRVLERLTERVARRWPALAHEGGSPLPIGAMLDELLRQSVRLRGGFALHLLCWVYGAGELWVVFALLGHRLSAAQALTIDSVVAGLRVAAVAVPMAAGVQEASYVLICAAFGLPPALAVAASLARRARDLTLGAMVLLAAAGNERRAAKLEAALDDEYRTRSRS